MLGCGSSGGIATIDCIFPLMGNAIYCLLFFSGSVAVIIIILSGIRFIVSGGESKSVETAKKSMTYAVLGLLLIFLSFLIINVIAYVTGVACLQDVTKGGLGFTSCQGTTSGSGPSIPACSTSCADSVSKCPRGALKDSDGNIQRTDCERVHSVCCAP